MHRRLHRLPYNCTLGPVLLNCKMHCPAKADGKMHCPAKADVFPHDHLHFNRHMSLRNCAFFPDSARVTSSCRFVDGRCLIASTRIYHMPFCLFLVSLQFKSSIIRFLEAFSATTTLDSRGGASSHIVRRNAANSYDPTVAILDSGLILLFHNWPQLQNRSHLKTGMFPNLPAALID